MNENYNDYEDKPVNIFENGPKVRKIQSVHIGSSVNLFPQANSSGILDYGESDGDVTKREQPTHEVPRKKSTKDSMIKVLAYQEGGTESKIKLLKEMIGKPIETKALNVIQNDMTDATLRRSIHSLQKYLKKQ